jgi:hypothetical protein
LYTTYFAKESETLPDKLAAALFPNSTEEPQPLEDKLAAAYSVATLFLYYNKEPEASANKPANTLLYLEEEPEPLEDKLTTLFSYSAKRSNYNCLSNITEESETSTDKVAILTPTKSIPTKKHPSKRSEKTVSKALQQSTSGQGRRSKK